MDSIHIILECPIKNKRYNIEITNDVTPFQLEQEFKEQFFNNDQKLKFFYQNQPLIHNKSLVSQNVVKGSLIIIRVINTITLMIPSLNKSYSIDIDESSTIQDITKQLLELLSLSSVEVQFQLGQQALKPAIPLVQQGVQQKSILTVNIQQQGGGQP